MPTQKSGNVACQITWDIEFQKTTIIAEHVWDLKALPSVDVTRTGDAKNDMMLSYITQRYITFYLYDNWGLRKTTNTSLY